jgi:MFS transporter, FHS family, L-fucose permease
MRRRAARPRRYLERHVRQQSVWKHRNLMLGALAIFAYVGAEVSIGSFLVNYLGQPNIAGLSPKTAAGYVSFYWGGAMIGRFAGAGILRRVKAGRVLAVCAVCAAALVATSMASSGAVAMWTILAVGLFNSIMFPTIFSLGVAELGPLTSSGSGVLNIKNKGRFEDLMGRLPMHVITARAALLGAASFGLEQTWKS